jgi:AI-2 transport protein TqsA
MRNQEFVASTVMQTAGSRFSQIVFAVVLVSAALYFGRTVLEPVAFVIFAFALVEPFRTAAETRLGKPVALILTILLTLVVLSLFVLAIVWSISDIAHWGIANAERLQALYARTTAWFAQYDLFIGDLTNLSSSTIVGIFRTVAGQVNSFIGFALIVLLSLVFGLVEMDGFKSKVAALDERMTG